MPCAFERLSLVISGIALCVACSESPTTQSPTFQNQGGSSSAGASATGGSASGGSASGGDAGNAAQVGGSGGSAQAGTSAGGTGSGGSASGGGGGSAPVTFKDGAIAAVSLTYDDGLDPHLAIVQPALEAAGFRGTFFLSSFEGVDNDWALPTTKMPLPPLSARHMAWQAAGQRGHELADHTVNHPCNSDSKAPGFHYTDYTMMRMQQELDDSIARLARLGAAPPLTFGYPCGGDKAGVGPAPGQDFSPLVAERFMAARVSVNGIADPATVDLLHVPQLDTGGKSGDELKKMIDDAIAAKGWLVLLFHGVGSEQASCPQNLGYAPDKCMINYLTTSAEAHQTLVDYLAEKKQQVWTATFKEVATAIKTARGK